MTRVFGVRSAQLSLALMSGIAALIGVAMVFSPRVRVPGLVLVVVWSTVALRALHSSCVVVHPDEIEIRSIVRARRHRLADLSRVEVGMRRMGIYGAAREFLVFERTDGRQFAFLEMNCRPPAQDDGDTVVRRAAAHINARLGESS